MFKRICNRPNPSRRPARTRLHLEQLEDRTAPAITLQGYTDLHAGDQVTIHVAFPSEDQNEDGEGEPLIIKAGNDVILYLNKHDQNRTLHYTAPRDEAITAEIPGED